MGVTSITKNSFTEEVVNSDKIVLIDFWAAWCAPCKMLTPIIEDFASDNDGIKVCKVNVDEEPGLAEQFGIMSIPTLIVFKDGKVVNKSVGLKNKAEIAKLVNV